MRLKYIYFVLIVVLGLLFTVSCKKLVTADAPFTSINAENVYSVDQTAIAVLNAMYVDLQSSSELGNNVNIISQVPAHATALLSDELALYGTPLAPSWGLFYKNSLDPNSADVFQTWSFLYSEIFKCNAAIEGLSDNSELSAHVQKQLIGESYFMRSYIYFQLVNLYGDVPLVLTTDPKQNETPARTNSDRVYEQMTADLLAAKSLLSSDFLDGTLSATIADRVRPTAWAADALLARVYLYRKMYKDAEAESSRVISNSQFYLDSLQNVFLTGSKETILQFKSVLASIGSGNTAQGAYYVLPSTGPDGINYPVYLNRGVVNDFENGDRRLSLWTGSVVVPNTVTPSLKDTFYYPYKYKSGRVNPSSQITENMMILRLAEQYLIRAEARAQQNNISGAQADLNAVRNRAWLPNTSASDKDALLAAIAHERRVEMFTEGDRWFDLKRTGKIDQVMSVVTPLKGGAWNTNWQLYPIPSSEILTDKNLIQNAGY